MEGYGQTESAGGVTISQSIDPESGHVGAPFPALEIKLIDVPDMNYSTDDVDERGLLRPRGEICYRGFSVFKGYYRQPELNKDIIDSDGWVHSGDIAQLDPIKGVFRIIDRKKNIFKLSQGEYVAPEKVELKLQQSFLISQAFIYGDSLQHYLVAVVVPDRHCVEKWAANNAIMIKDESYEEFLNRDPRINKVIMNEIQTNCKNAGLFGFEIPQRVFLTSKAFS
jgi:long-chain acyl-CoA synthetase